MADVKDLKVGQKVTYRGRAGELMEVDQSSGQVKFRYDVPREQAVSSDGVRVPNPSDVTVFSVDVAPIPAAEVGQDPAFPMRGAKAAVPTAAQIAAARKAAAERVKGEKLSAAERDAVQDEAESELVARMGRGEPA